MRKKSACVILMTILLLVLVPLSAAIVYHPGLVRDAFPSEVVGCLTELNTCGRNIDCVKGKSGICKDNPYVTIVCKEGNVSIGGSIETCTINESQIIFSGNYLLVYNFTNFIIEKGPLKYRDIELRVVSLSTLLVGGGAEGGTTVKGKHNQGGGQGGKGATLTSFAYAGMKGNNGYAKGGEGGYGGGSIVIYAKNFTNYGKLNANGVLGEAGEGEEGAEGGGGGGGGGGGLVVINADYFDNQGTISAEGGVGGLGGENYGGGGGGGDGGAIHLNVKEINNRGDISVDGGPGGCSAWNLTEEGDKENNFCGAQGGYENWLINDFWFAPKEREIKKDGEKGHCLAEKERSRGWNILDSCLRIEFNICDPKHDVPEGEPQCKLKRDDMNHSVALRVYECVSHKLWHKHYYCLGAAAPETSGGIDVPTIGEEEPGQNGKNGAIIEANCIYKAYNESILLKNNGDFWCDYFSNNENNYDVETGGDKVGTLHMLFWCNDGNIAASQLSNRAHICKDGEFNLNLFSQCFKLGSENCASNWQCRKINGKCVPKYPSAEADCSYGNNIINGNGECILNSSTYFQPYKECVIGKVMGDTLNPYKAICGSVGDCGNNSHFLGISLGEGYDIIPLDNSNALFKCEKVELKPQTSNTCLECNKKPLSEYGRCTDYVCSSLGSDCKYNSETKQCEKTYSGIDPYLTDIGISAKGYECKIEKEVVEGKVLPSITLSCETSGGCILPYSKLKLTYSTNNDTICKIAIYPKSQSLSASWENMSNADNNANLFTTQHVWDIPAYFFPKLEQDVSAHAYLVCKNRYGKNTTYEINFCVSGTDNIPPAIETSYVDREEVAPGSQSMKIYVNEPVKNCAVTLSSGEQPSISFSYSKEGKIVAEFSFNMPTQDLSIQIQCEDESGNVGGKSLTLIPAVRGIFLTIQSPQDNSIFTTCDNEVEINYTLSVDTACNLVGCSVKACNTSCETFSLGQDLQGKIKLGNGSYVLNFSCSDSCNFEASQNVSISVNVDKKGPHVKRLYKEGGNLVIITDKKASCYELAGCKDVMQNELVFISPFSQNAINHLLPWRLAPYYAWCQDECGNGECNIINPL